jgi:Fic family protein
MKKVTQFKAGKLVKQTDYKSFMPEFINHEWLLDDAELAHLAAEASLKLGKLNGLSMVIPDVDLFIRMHVVKEATTSSKIEGTQTNMEEAMLSAKEISPEKRNDWQEVHNYISAMQKAMKELHKLPLSNRLLRNAHHTLMQGVRGKHKQPGEFRRSQNWIGGATIKDAMYVPPHHNNVADLMSDLEKFIHNEAITLPVLLKAALAHYQFETIHPFLDGNGRVGRLLITLILVSEGVLDKPSLYLSDFFEKNRQLYYDNLNAVRTKNDLKRWFRFFLIGVIQTADSSLTTFKKILKLKEEIEIKRLTKLGKRYALGKQLLDYLFAKPVITAAEISTALKITTPTAHSLIAVFVKMKILKEQTGFKRNKRFVFYDYMALFKN